MTIPPQPADPAGLPELLKGFGAVPPLVTDIDLSLDDKYLHVACWGTGEMHQYDVSDPMTPILAGKVELGGIVARHKHPNGKTFGYGPQMVEISRDGKRVYWTNPLYSTWDDQFHPGERGGAMVKADVGAKGGLTLDKSFFVEFPKGYRSHRIRLERGDRSTDSIATLPPDGWRVAILQRPSGGPLSRPASTTGSIRAWAGPSRCPPR